MKKNIKYILLLILFLIPVISVKAATGDKCDPITETVTRKVGETFTITCSKSIDNAANSCMGTGGNNTGLCQNSSKGNVLEATANFSLSSSGSTYTLTSQNIGYNFFECDTWGTNKCYHIIITDENGNKYYDLHPIESGVTYSASGNFSTTPKEGYGCYYLTSNSLGIDKFVFYTNRDMSGTGALDLFSGDNNIQTVWAHRGSYMENYSGIEYDMTTFENYSSGQPMSADTCAAAGAVIMKSNGSGWGGGSAGNVQFVEELDSGEAGVYDVFSFADDFSSNGTDDSSNYSTNNQVLLLYGNGFKVHSADYSSSDPYNCDDCFTTNAELFQITAARERTDFMSFYGIDTCFSSISSQAEMKTCFGCNGSAITSPCRSPNIYTIGVLAEPETVTGLVDGIEGADPNKVVDGTVTGIVDSEAGLYNWTCEDVKYTTFIYNALRLIAPFLLIIFASLDYFKAVVAGDIKKQQEARVKAPKRLIAFLLLLILPFIVSWMFKAFGGYGSNVTTAFCCVATNGNQNCSIGSSNSGTPTPTTPTNTSQVDEVTAENLCNGNNYLSPNKITTVCSVKDCINNRYGECLSTNIDDGICNKCEYTPLSISEDLCTSNCGVGYKSGQCFFNMVKGVSTSSISNISNSGLTLIKKVHQSGTTGDYHDGYFNYDRKIKENVTQTVCTNELNGTPYDCDSSGNSCSCLYGKSIISNN